jgi:hypothetical protein
MIMGINSVRRTSKPVVRDAFVGSNPAAIATATALSSLGVVFFLLTDGPQRPLARLAHNVGCVRQSRVETGLLRLCPCQDGQALPCEGVGGLEGRQGGPCLHSYVVGLIIRQH